MEALRTDNDCPGFCEQYFKIDGKCQRAATDLVKCLIDAGQGPLVEQAQRFIKERCNTNGAQQAVLSGLVVLLTATFWMF
jgi:hypothetical protein